ncbi:hypothetical protein [Cellulosilyticum ruminicola]|uniref:hypothetical protein n=1 Tax=Cellulosilyticum ruminicola TaxID=425254 RepID=UPI0006D23210|nr:hypothetical protein [Cellulosilyticum ruminicola]
MVKYSLIPCGEKEVESTFYYTEQIEEINTLEKGMHSKKRKLSKRKIVDELKEAGKILDVNLRYRQKYKILIQLLAWREVPILKSHTPRQICEEALNSNLKLDLTQETEGYENVKYGEMLAAEEAEQVMNLHLNQILGSKG